jgi:lysozyme
MMNISRRGLDLIAHFESFQPKPYICPAGKLTIGYGHVIRSDEKFTRIDERKANEILLADCKLAEQAVKQVESHLNQNQFDALVCFVFNVGNQAFLTSTMRKLIIADKLDEAADQFDRWVHAGKKVLQGLVNRRHAEKQLFLKKDA